MEAGGGGVRKKGESVGKRLLEDIEQQKETLTTLLTDLRLTGQHHNNTSSVLHVPLIDDLLRPHLQDHAYNQSLAMQVLESTKTHDSFIGAHADADGLPRDRPVIIEISSDTSYAGKTQLLYYLACVAILPTTWNGIKLDGKDGAVVFIDCENGFDILRLAAVVESYVQDKLSKAMVYCQEKKANADGKMQDEQDDMGDEIDEYIALLQSITLLHIEELTDFALSHVHLHQPKSSSEFLDILQNIPSYLESSPSHISHDRPLASIMIDGISAYYWLERASSIVQNDQEEPMPHNSSEISLQTRYELITSHLLNVSKRLGANILITNITIPSANPESNMSTHSSTRNTTPQFPRHLPRCYTYSPKFLSARITLSRDQVAPFHADINLVEAWQERNMRMEVVRKAGISAWVEGAGIRNQAMKASGGWFWFRITEKGVQIGVDEENS